MSILVYNSTTYKKRQEDIIKAYKSNDVCKLFLCLIYDADGKYMNGVIEPMVNVKPVQLGKNVRMSFSRIDEVLDMPNLIEVQKNSYKWFLDEGLKEVFKDVSGITDYTGNLVLDFVNYKLDDDKPNYSVEECKERDATYAAALRVTARLLNKESGEIKESEVFMGDFPLMTDSGTFVINGAERVIVSQ
ncbi:MAG: rpoB, partial [Caproiciproducens sp.]|nr:rpoB [Caproiciproducens sp.]